MSFFDRLDPKYRLILCDVWGCVHDGVRLYQGASQRLMTWRSEGRKIVLVTNAPRPASTVELSLGWLGLPSNAWDAIATAGGAGIANLVGKHVGFLGTADDRVDMEANGLRIARGEDFDELVCCGLDEWRDNVEDYIEDLQLWMERDVLMHCLNPDRVVVVGSDLVPCAGALADIYEAMGGRVIWYGKPYPAIYEHALSLAGNPPPGEVLAIGDGLQTDVLGAARMGFDCVFVTGGIHEGEEFPDDFAERHGLGDWSPVAVVDSLGEG